MFDRLRFWSQVLRITNATTCLSRPRCSKLAACITFLYGIFGFLSTTNIVAALLSRQKSELFLGLEFGRTIANLFFFPFFCMSVQIEIPNVVELVANIFREMTMSFVRLPTCSARRRYDNKSINRTVNNIIFYYNEEFFSFTSNFIICCARLMLSVNGMKANS